MKKLFAFISVLAACSALMFADVSAQKNADGSIAVTFFYGNPRATEVLLAGDFTNWQDGALPMEKGEKGFSLTVNFKAGEEGRYKFISDGNWTTDLRAPDFVDDGFGGKNSHIVIDDLVGGGDDTGAAKAKINFISWTMIGVQGNYITQSKTDATKKGLDLDSVTVGMKSYNKFAGNFLPNCPVYVEIALAETELENYAGNSKLRYLFQKDQYDETVVDWDEGFKNLVSGVFSAPVEYFALTTDNDVKNDHGTGNGSIPGPGSNPFLGHLKFGFSTPYIKYVTGFNYAKPEIRNAITWTTVAGNWDAGYQHIGGFNVFSLGDKAVASLEEATGLTFDIGFAPNKTADRKGSKYGYWGWFGVAKDDLAIDFQTNGMYDGEYMFYKPVEHDFILGVKDTLRLDAGKVNLAAQALVSTHQKEFVDGANDNAIDYFGYSTDIWYRSSSFDGIQNIAGNVNVGFENDTFGANVEYRFRGAQASMLYVRENHDDATFDLSDQLGVANEQRVAFNGFVNATENVTVNLGVKAKMPLQKFDGDEEVVVQSIAARPTWYDGRFDDNRALFFRGENGGVEFTFQPSVDLALNDAISFNVYGDFKYRAYKYMDAVTDEDKANEYGASDSPFLFKLAGLSASIKPDSDVIKGVNLYYGFDNSNSVRLFNTLVGQVKFPSNVTATVGFGLKTLKSTDAKKASEYEEDSAINNPFAFAVGVAKQFQALKKPTVYAQFVFNNDPFKHFGDGQDNLNLDRANVNGSVEKEGVGAIDPVDWYDGRAAVRVGIRWDI